MNRTAQRRDRLNYLLRTALPTAAFFLVVVGVIALFSIGVPLYVAGDVRGAPHRLAEARVMAVSPVPGGRFRDPESSVTLRLVGGNVDCISLIPLHVGERVRVDYQL